MASKSPEISVVVPVFDEEGAAPALAREIAAAFKGRSYEMVFVDDASRDGTRTALKALQKEIPQLRLNSQYRKMLDRDNGATKEVRDYVRERYTSAIQLMKNIEQRKQTIQKVCLAIKRRQMEFLQFGID